MIFLHATNMLKSSLRFSNLATTSLSRSASYQCYKNLEQLRLALKSVIIIGTTTVDTMKKLLYPISVGQIPTQWNGDTKQFCTVPKSSRS